MQSKPLERVTMVMFFDCLFKTGHLKKKVQYLYFRTFYHYPNLERPYVS